MRRFPGAACGLAMALLLAVQSVSVGATEDEWVTRIDDDGLVVETRDVDGSDYKAFRASITVPAGPEQVLARIQDVLSYPEWFPDTVAARRVPTADGRRANYVRTDAPWPVRDRDAIYTQSLNRADGEITIDVGVAPDLLPESDDAVRVRRAGGRWSLRAVDEGTVIAWQFHLEPGGRVPSRLANARVVDTPKRALLALRDYFADRNRAAQGNQAYTPSHSTAR